MRPSTKPKNGRERQPAVALVSQRASQGAAKSAAKSRHNPPACAGTALWNASKACTSAITAAPARTAAATRLVELARASRLLTYAEVLLAVELAA